MGNVANGLPWGILRCEENLLSSIKSLCNVMEPSDNTNTKIQFANEHYKLTIWF